jgi:hypothetical protein
MGVLDGESRLGRTVDMLRSRKPLVIRDLLPPALAYLRRAFPIRTIEIASHPQANPSGHLQYQQGNYLRFLQTIEPDVLSSQSDFAIMDKTFPHSPLEIMLMQSGRKIKPSFDCLCDFEQAFLVQTMINFGKFNSRDGSILPQISWNFDPYTKDRYPVQSVRRLHVHLTTQPWDIGGSAPDTQLSELDIFRGRDVLDEASIIASCILNDIFEDPNFLAIEPFNPEVRSPYLQFYLGDNWSTINGGHLSELINSIIKTYMNKWGVLSEILFNTMPKATKSLRREVKPITTPGDLEKIRGELLKLKLQNTTIDTLLFYLQRVDSSLLSQMRDILPTDALKLNVQKDQYKDVAAFLFPLNGPAYSILMYQNYSGEIYLMFRPCFFTRIGGSGVGFRDGYMYLIKKGSGVMTGDDVAARGKFQSDFLEYNRGERLSYAASRYGEFTSVFSNAGTMKICYSSPDPELSDFLYLTYRPEIGSSSVHRYINGYRYLQSKVSSLPNIHIIVDNDTSVIIGYISEKITGTFENLPEREKAIALQGVSRKHIISLVTDFLNSICDVGCLDIWGNDNIYWNGYKFVFIDPAIHGTLFENETPQIAFRASIEHIQKKFAGSGVDETIFNDIIEAVRLHIKIGHCINSQWHGYDNLHTLDSSKMNLILQAIANLME